MVDCCSSYIIASLAVSSCREGETASKSATDGMKKEGEAIEREGLAAERVSLLE